MLRVTRPSTHGGHAGRARSTSSRRWRAAVAGRREREHRVGAELGDRVRQRLERGHRPRRVADDVERDVEAGRARARRRAAKRPSIASQFARPIGLTCEIWSRQPLARASRSPRPSRGRTARRCRACGRRRARRAPRRRARAPPAPTGRRSGPGSTRARPRARPRRRRGPRRAAPASARARPASPAAAASPSTVARSVLCPTKGATLSGSPRRSISSRYSRDRSPVPAELAGDEPTSSIRSIAPAAERRRRAAQARCRSCRRPRS